MEKAHPIWLRGLHRERNIQAGFRADLNLVGVPADAVLRVTASTLYRATVNGQFAGYGPAKPPHGYARVDEIPIARLLRPGLNTVAIEVAGYNDDNFYTIDDPSFLLAEVVAEGKVLTATGEGWGALRLPRRQAVERHGYQRPFTEIWDLDEVYATWQTAPMASLPFAEPEVLGLSRKLIPRGVPMPRFDLFPPAQVVSLGTMMPDPDRPLTGLRERSNMFPEAEIAEFPSRECGQERPGPFRGKATGLRGFGHGEPLHVRDAAGDTTIFLETGTLRAAFLLLDFEADTPATIDLIHVEKLNEDGELDPRLDACVQVTRLHAPAGRFRFETFEVASTRYLRLVVRGASEFRLHGVSFREYAYPALRGGSFLCSDGALNRIVEAARVTLRANTIDEFYDCPSRERAGWLCDSLFSSRAAFYLMGDTAADHVMLEDFLLPETFPGLPEGMVPHCYPAGRLGHIPNWALFFLLQLGEHLHRTGDAAFVARFRDRVEKLIACFDNYVGPEGLLENLDGWVFVDWSIANERDYVQPISTACNALFARALEVSGELFQRSDWTERAEAIRATLRDRARIPGRQLFGDTLARGEDGVLRPTGKVSEACQYYALWTGMVDVKDVPALQSVLLEEFGPAPDRYTAWLNVGRANLFIGQYLRLDMLARWGQHARLLREMRDLFLPMIDRGPGTLWENLSPHASVCHGFASHAAVWLMRDFLGLNEIDVQEKRVAIAPYLGELRWASGSVEVPEGVISLSWSLDGDTFRLNASVPEGYTVSLLPPQAVRLAAQVTLDGEPLSLGAGRLENLPTAFQLTAKL